MREWRVGRITLGILFLAIGAVLLLRLFTEINLAPIIKYGVPIIVIVLGLEVLIFTLFATSKVRFSVSSIVIILLVLAALFSFGLFIENSPIYNFGNITQHGSSDQGLADGISRHQIDLSDDIRLLAGTKKVSVDVTNGNLEIIGSETDRIKLTGTVTVTAATQKAAAKDVEKYFSTKFVGNELRISYDDKQAGVSIGFLTKSMPVVNLKLEVPAELLVSGDLINGNISVENVIGELDLKVVNGRIEITSERLSADIDAEVVNGKIDLRLPRDSDAIIEAEVKIGLVGGNIEWIDKSDSDIRLGAEKSAQLNRGRHEIELSVVNGNIAVDLQEEPALY